MKARSAICLYGGERIKFAQSFDQLFTMIAPLLNSKPGSAYAFERLTDHGTVKRVLIPIAQVTHIEEL